jgi:hypothetical protein
MSESAFWITTIMFYDNIKDNFYVYKIIKKIILKKYKKKKGYEPAFNAHYFFIVC